MITVNGWCACGKGGCSVNGGDGERLLSKHSSTVSSSATRYGEQTGMPYSRCGRTKVPYKGMKADFERSWNDSLNDTGLFSPLRRH